MNPFKQKKIKLTELQRQLESLGVSYKTIGIIEDCDYSFKSLKQIEPNGIYFITDEDYDFSKLSKSIIFFSGEVEVENNLIIQVENPQLTFYKLMEVMVADNNRPSGVHYTAVIGADCVVDSSAYIGPFCVLEGCVIKARARLHSHVTVMRGTIIAEDVIIESHSTIGATGVAWIWDPSTRRRVIQPQTGYTLIGRGTFLGSDISVVRGSVNEVTKIGERCVIAHGSKIGHGSQIGSECHFANNVSIAGNVILGDQCFLGSGVIVRPQTSIADRTVIGAGAVVVKHLEVPGMLLIGAPAKPTELKSNKISGVPKLLGS